MLKLFVTAFIVGLILGFWGVRRAKAENTTPLSLDRPVLLTTGG